ncbi:uncharacterized protein DS421_5g137230 [Arachis hypogaea]|nr:uncharacterized protein DS421_5g137230 [Arachis hypogaea]
MEIKNNEERKQREKHVNEDGEREGKKGKKIRRGRRRRGRGRCSENVQYGSKRVMTCKDLYKKTLVCEKLFFFFMVKCWLQNIKIPGLLDFFFNYFIGLYN